MATFRPIFFKTTLARSLAQGGSETEIYLNSFTTKDSHTLAMSEVGDKLFILINPRGENRELCSITGINTAVTPPKGTGLTRGYNFYDSNTSTDRKKPHSPGETVIITNDDHFLNEQYVDIDSAQTINGLKTFALAARPQLASDADATDDKEFVTKGQLTRTALGTIVTNRVVTTETAGESVVAGNLVYFKESDQKWWKCDTDAFATSANVKLGIAQGSASANGTVNVLLYGLDQNQASMTPGSKYYLSGTAGGIDLSLASVPRFVGWAKSATNLFFAPADFDPALVQVVSGEALSVGQVVYFKTSDQRWWRTDADATSTATGVYIGIVQTATTAGGQIFIIRRGGVDQTQTGLTPGSAYYLSGTAGAISTSAGTNQRSIGIAISATQLLMESTYNPDLVTQTDFDAYRSYATAGENITAGDPLYLRNVTTTTISSTEANYLDQANPSSAQGSQTSISVGLGSSTNLRRGLVKFDVSSLGSTPGDILKAVLRLYISSRGYFTGIAPSDMYVSPQTSAWTESSTYNSFNASFVKTNCVGAVVDPGAAGYIDIDVTGAVKDWVNGTTNNGFGIWAGNENTASQCDFDSDDGSNVPQLVCTIRDTSNNGKVYKAKANNTYTCFTFVGIATETATTGNTVRFNTIGSRNGNQSGLTAGKPIYITDAGAISHTPGTIKYQIGYAISATAVIIAPAARKHRVRLYSSGLGSEGGQYRIYSTGVASAPIMYAGIPLGFRPRRIRAMVNGMKYSGSTPTGLQQTIGEAYDDAGTFRQQYITNGTQSTTSYSAGAADGLLGTAHTTNGNYLTMITVPNTGAYVGFTDLAALLRIDFPTGVTSFVGDCLLEFEE